MPGLARASAAMPIGVAADVGGRHAAVAAATAEPRAKGLGGAAWWPLHLARVGACRARARGAVTHVDGAGWCHNDDEIVEVDATQRSAALGECSDLESNICRFIFDPLTRYPNSPSDYWKKTA